MKLFLKISNLCNHNTSTLRTDGQTDGQTTCHSNTALCVASRGKNSENQKNSVMRLQSRSNSELFLIKPITELLHLEIMCVHTIRYDTIEEFNVDSKAEYTA